MNWRLILALAACVTFWMLAGWWVWHREPPPSIFGTATAPVPADELLTLNPE